MFQMHSGWEERGFPAVEIRFVCFDFTDRPEVFLKVLALPHVTELIFPARPFVGGIDGSDAVITSLPEGEVHNAVEVNLDFWRRTSGIMCPVLHGNRAGIGLRGWDSVAPLLPGLTTRNCALDLSLDFPVEPCSLVSRTWMRELFSQVMTVFRTDLARVFVTKVGSGDRYDCYEWTDAQGKPQSARVSWLTYYTPVVLAHVGRDRVEKCSAHVEFDFFGGALLCTAEEPCSLYPRDLYERTRRVNEELGQIEPPPPPGSPKKVW